MNELTKEEKDKREMKAFKVTEISSKCINIELTNKGMSVSRCPKGIKIILKDFIFGGELQDKYRLSSPCGGAIYSLHTWEEMGEESDTSS